ncbi:MAG: hypothetical protein ABEK84_09000 [Salinibacter sp.]
MIPSSFFRPFRLPIGSLLLCGGALLLGGCDGAGSKRASLYARLTDTGTWRIERLDGPLTAPTRLEERYSEVRVTFRDEKAGRRYRIVGQFSADSSAVLADGLVRLPGDDALRMATGFRRPVTWTYTFEASRAVFTLQFGSRVFLGTLFPGTTWGQSRDLTMTLAPDDE